MKNLADLLKEQTDQRLLRLFVVGCCRHIWAELTDGRSRTAVEVAERFADGKATRKELKEANGAAWSIAKGTDPNVFWTVARYAVWAVIDVSVFNTAYLASNTAYHAAHHSAYYAPRKTANTAVYSVAYNAAREKQLELYNCLFTKVVFTTTSPNALNLAKLIYLERNWSLMPILGDALEEAGVSEEAVSHCKEKEHARGCWVVDNLLGHRK